MKRKIASLMAIFILVNVIFSMSGKKVFADENNEKSLTDNHSYLVTNATGGNATYYVIKDSGNLWEISYQDFEKIENGTTMSKTNAKIFMKNVKQIHGSHYAIFALKDNGDLWTWGVNYWGDTGDGTTISRKKPIKILSNIQKVYVDGVGNYALSNNGDLYSWGYNLDGSGGIGILQGKIYKPTKILTKVKKLSQGLYSSFALRENGDVWAWGDNRYGGVGNGTRMPTASPVKIAKGMIDIHAGLHGSFAISKNNDLYVWGRSHRHGFAPQDIMFLEPTFYMSDVKKVAYDGYDLMILKSNDELYVMKKTIDFKDEVDTYNPNEIYKNRMYFDDNQIRFMSGIAVGLVYYPQYTQEDVIQTYTPHKVMNNVKDIYADNGRTFAINFENQLFTSVHDDEFVKLSNNIKYLSNSACNIMITTKGNMYSWEDISSYGEEPIYELTKLITKVRMD